MLRITSSDWGYHKLFFLRGGSIELVLLYLLLWFWLRQQPGNVRRFAILMLASAGTLAPAVWAHEPTPKFYREVLWSQMERLDITRPRRLPDYERRFAKARFVDGSSTGFPPLLAAIHRRYSADSAIVRQNWDDLGEQTRFATYLMNVVSHMWVYGNSSAPLKVGCVGQNEQTAFRQIPVSSMTVQQYLTSTIGCCTDYATLLKHLLDMSAIQNRLVEIPGHVINEALLDHHWFTLDPTTNTLIWGRWEEIAKAKSRPVSAMLFPLAADYAGEAKRPVLSRFRMYLLTSLSSGTLETLAYRDTLGANDLPRETLAH